MSDPRVVNLRDFRRRRSESWVYDLPADVVRVDRRSRWGNPFKIGDDVNGFPMTRAVAVHEYAWWLAKRLQAEPRFLEPLRGKRLACWCAPDLCHAEVILERLDSAVPLGDGDVVNEDVTRHAIGGREAG